MFLFLVLIKKHPKKIKQIKTETKQSLQTIERIKLGTSKQHSP